MYIICNIANFVAAVESIVVLMMDCYCRFSKRINIVNSLGGRFKYTYIS